MKRKLNKRILIFFALFVIILLCVWVQYANNKINYNRMYETTVHLSNERKALVEEVIGLENEIEDIKGTTMKYAAEILRLTGENENSEVYLRFDSVLNSLNEELDISKQSLLNSEYISKLDSTEFAQFLINIRDKFEKIKSSFSSESKNFNQDFNLETRNPDDQNEIEKLQKINNQLMSEKVRQENELNKLREELNTVKKQEKEDEEKIAMLTDELQQKEEEMERILLAIDSSNKVISFLEKELDEARDIIEGFTVKGFDARYKYRQGSQREMIGILSIEGYHPRRQVKTIEIDFIVSRKYISDPGMRTVQVGLYHRGGKKLVNPRYAIDAIVDDHQVYHILELESLLDRGYYVFVVSYQGQKIYNHEFKIS
ncbi:MAG: hypothetical protein MI974_01870 [Chitinophagales bacterium]|nr:hypothetical protein [Chitinophagales bacterium]